MVIALLALAATSVMHCAAEDARYTLRLHPDVSAYFKTVDSGPDWPSGLALVVHSRKFGETTWWLPWNGGTDNLQNVASTTDVTARDWRPPNPDGGPRPFGNRQYLGTDAHYNIIGTIPHRGQPAPIHMLIPDAGSAHDEAFPAKQFFDLVGCSRHSNQSANAPKR